MLKQLGISQVRRQEIQRGCARASQQRVDGGMPGWRVHWRPPAAQRAATRTRLGPSAPVLLPSQTVSASQMQAMFREHDRDFSGALDLDEFIGFFNMVRFVWSEAQGQNFRPPARPVRQRE